MKEIVGLRVAVYDSDGPFNSFSGTDASVEVSGVNPKP